LGQHQTFDSRSGVPDCSVGTGFRGPSEATVRSSKHDGAERVAKPRILIANRGEIAVRIIRRVRELCFTSIAVYSDADRDALHVEMADQAHRIGPALAADSYLSIGATLEAGARARGRMTHPGTGRRSATGRPRRAPDRPGHARARHARPGAGRGRTDRVPRPGQGRVRWRG